MFYYQDILLQIGASFKAGSTDTLIGAFKEIGGKGAGALVAAFKDGLDEQIQSAREAGAIMAAEQIAVIKGLKDQLAALTQVITVQTGPAIVGVLKAMVEAGFGLRTVFAFFHGLLKNVPATTLVDALNGNPVALGQLVRGVDFGQAKKEAEASGKDAAAFNDRMAAIIKNMAAELKNPSSGDFSSIQPTPLAVKQMTVKEAAIPSDSLVNVGNFLGASTSTIQRIGERTNSLLYSIDQRLSRMENSNSFGGFPSTV